MRKIIAGMFITADGVVEAPENWNPPYYNQEMTDVVQGQMAGCDTHLYGRRSYELFRAVFTGPKAAHIPHAPLMNEALKIVVSTTLSQPDWGPTTLISTNVADQLHELKTRPGKTSTSEPVARSSDSYSRNAYSTSYSSWSTRSSSAPASTCSSRARNRYRSSYSRQPHSAQA